MSFGEITGDIEVQNIFVLLIFFTTIPLWIAVFLQEPGPQRMGSAFATLLRQLFWELLSALRLPTAWLSVTYGIPQAGRNSRRSLTQSPAKSRAIHEVKQSHSRLHPSQSLKPPMKICKCYPNKCLYLRSQGQVYQHVHQFIDFSYEESPLSDLSLYHRFLSLPASF